MDRRLRELTEEVSSAGRIREPSAAERAKAAKKRPVRRRRGGRVAGWSVAVVVLAGAGFFGWHQVSRPGVGGPNDTQVVTNGAVPSTSASPTAASSTAALSPGARPLTGSPADPFAGTAADQWADGAAGITLRRPLPMAPSPPARSPLPTRRRASC